MRVGTVSAVRLVGVIPFRVGAAFESVADYAVALGNPVIPTPIALLVGFLVADGYRARAAGVFSISSLVDLVSKDLGWSTLSDDRVSALAEAVGVREYGAVRRIDSDRRGNS